MVVQQHYVVYNTMQPAFVPCLTSHPCYSAGLPYLFLVSCFLFLRHPLKRRVVNKYTEEQYPEQQFRYCSVQLRTVQAAH